MTLLFAAFVSAQMQKKEHPRKERRIKQNGFKKIWALPIIRKESIPHYFALRQGSGGRNENALGERPEATNAGNSKQQG